MTRRAQALVLELAVLGAVGCGQPRVEPKPAPAVVDHLEVLVVAPGFSPASVEQLVVAPIELALVGNSDIRGMISEVREGEARIDLALSNRSELVAVDVLQRVAAIESRLPAEVEPPVLRARGPRPTTLHFGLGDHRREHAQTLLEELERTAGVIEVSRCGLDPAITIELDPDALRRLALDVGEVERAARSALTMQPIASVEALSELVVAQSNGSAVLFSDLATVRAGPTIDGCRAHAQQGSGTGIAVRLHDEARDRVEARIDAARERGLAVQRFAARLHVWLAPELELEQTIQRVRELAGSAWLLEVGVAAEPCAGPGTLARLHLADGSTLDAIAEALATVPGVTLVEDPEQPQPRRWLVGPDVEVLARLGGEARPELAIELDQDKLAALGLGRDAAILALQLAVHGVELGHIREDSGTLLPVQLKLGRVDARDPAGLAALPLSVNAVLGDVATLRDELVPTRICRRDGERGVVLIDRPDIELPDGYRWLDEE